MILRWRGSPLETSDCFRQQCHYHNVLWNPRPAYCRVDIDELDGQLTKYNATYEAQKRHEWLPIVGTLDTDDHLRKSVSILGYGSIGRQSTSSLSHST